jgi:hypothetical protein
VLDPDASYAGDEVLKTVLKVIKSETKVAVARLKRGEPLMPSDDDANANESGKTTASAPPTPVVAPKAVDVNVQRDVTPAPSVAESPVPTTTSHVADAADTRSRASPVPPTHAVASSAPVATTAEVSRKDDEWDEDAPDATAAAVVAAVPAAVHDTSALDTSELDGAGTSTPIKRASTPVVVDTPAPRALVAAPPQPPPPSAVDDPLVRVMVVWCVLVIAVGVHRARQVLTTTSSIASPHRQQPRQ